MEGNTTIEDNKRCKKRKEIVPKRRRASEIAGFLGNEREGTSFSMEKSPAIVKRKRVIISDSSLSEDDEIQEIRFKPKRKKRKRSVSVVNIGDDAEESTTTQNKENDAEVIFDHEVLNETINTQLRNQVSAHMPSKEDNVGKDTIDIEEEAVSQQPKQFEKDSPMEVIDLSKEEESVEPADRTLPVVKRESPKDEDYWYGQMPAPQSFEPMMTDYINDWSMPMFFAALKDVVVSSNIDLLKRVQETKTTLPSPKPPTLECEPTCSVPSTSEKKATSKIGTKLAKKEILVKPFIEKLNEGVTSLNCPELDPTRAHFEEFLQKIGDKSVSVEKMKLVISAALAILSG